VVPIKSKITKSYYPERELSMQVTPKPNKKFISGPEKIPATAVEVYPFFANATIDR
jgi:hypothetical protein